MGEPRALGRWRARLEGSFWGRSQLWRRPGRRLAEALSVLRYRWRARRRALPLRVVHAAGDTANEARPLWILGAPEPALEEGLRMAAAAEDLDLAVADGARALATPRAGGARVDFGRRLPLVGHSGSGPDAAAWPLGVSGPYLLPPGAAEGRVLRRPLYAVDRALRALPPVDGPPATLFLLPFLAVGGAERLLFDLLSDLVRDTGRRDLVVTLDPHREHLGQTVDRCRALTPFVFTLGDWLPRRAAFGALRHLVRRYRVDRIFSWNGTVDFFDRVHELRRDFPGLRLFSQLYHHRGGWTSRTSPRVIRSVDRHIAVNRTIVDALAARGVPASRIELIHHGVETPAEPPSAAARAERRRQLGLPQDAVVFGTFIRLHPQKRPLDVLELARRFSGEPVYFLLVGGGPMDDDLEADLRARPAPNLVKRGLTTEPLPLYDALDGCLMTSDYEGLPVFLLDGLARGLPGVAPAVGDIPLLFDDGGGLTVGRPGDLDGLEAAVRRLLEPGELGRRGAVARRTVRGRFDLETYRAAYRRVLDRPAEGVRGPA
ncbi:MAG: glycosyltransferase family 4 protein [Acidobacteriota bacterium]